MGFGEKTMKLKKFGICMFELNEFSLSLISFLQMGNLGSAFCSLFGNGGIRNVKRVGNFLFVKIPF